ncbi:MAG: NUDIX domain-containing protein [Candidatus Shapirobacteria bacterium]|jgi:8-oxo-dGTP diphosphatase
MKKCDCELCKFENPKPTVTAVIIRDGKILVLKRNENPFAGEWDFAGGYLQKNETPEEALKRELKEELGVESDLKFLGYFAGTASYHDYEFPVINIAYYANLLGDIKLNTEENSEVVWMPISELETVAFDSNQKILKYIKKQKRED